MLVVSCPLAFLPFPVSCCCCCFLFFPFLFSPSLLVATRCRTGAPGAVQQRRQACWEPGLRDFVDSFSFFSVWCPEPAGRCPASLLLFACPTYPGGIDASAHADVTEVVRLRKPLPAMALSFLSSTSVLLITLLFWRHAAALQQTTHDVGCIHLPIVHSSNVNQFSNKRGVQLQLANRSDVAYYAQRTCSLLTTPPVRVRL